MMATVVGNLIFFNSRRLVEVFPESLRNVWSDWQLRVAVMLSLFLQMILITLGSRRKYIAGSWIRVILWVAYLSADWIINLSLGVLSSMDTYDDKNGSVDPKYVIMAFWAPFLLVHLGGPDTITALSLEDNEIWSRTLLGLVVKFGGAFYVFLKSWTGSPVNFLAIPMFIAGMVKCGERTWALWSASSDHLRNSMIPSPEPGPNYADFMDDYASKMAEDYNIWLVPVIEQTSIALNQSGEAEAKNGVSDASILQDASKLFGTFRRLFADLILSFQDINNSLSIIKDKQKTWDKAFKLIEIEIGFLYDMFYTKAVVIHSYLGSFVRLISLSSSIFALIVFCVIDKHVFSTIDIGITYPLLVGAIALELYAITMLLSSDRTLLWLSTKHKNLPVRLFYKIISCFQSFLQSCYLIPDVRKRWSNSMAKYSLLSFCLKDRGTKFVQMQQFLRIYDMLEKYRCKDTETVSDELKILIFEQLRQKSMKELEISNSKQLCAQKGDQVLKDKGFFEEIGWSVEVEFDESILLWHIATDLCYFDDLNRNPNIFDNTTKYKASKSLAGYMLYLLIMRPFMLPSGIGLIRFRDTREEATRFFKQRRCDSGNFKQRSDSVNKQACSLLLKVNTDIAPSQVKGDRSKSVLFDACRLAKSLQELERKGKWRTNEEKWEMINQVWVEMMCYAASQCEWQNHARQLTAGGELLTHVWLLMAHLGITEQFRIGKGNARVKLNFN